MKPYRKIWIDNFGDIPIDSDGRSFEIHHIDGDNSNNNISNLKCVSIKEHYEIHLAQGDLYACSYIAARMAIKPRDLKEIRSKATKNMHQKLLSENRHWTKTDAFKQKISKITKERNKRLVSEKTHNFVTNNPSIERSKNGTHNWQSAKNTVPCYNKNGNYLRIPSDVFHSQQGPKNCWEYVHNTSTEGKRRKLLSK